MFQRQPLIFNLEFNILLDFQYVLWTWIIISGVFRARSDVWGGAFSRSAIGFETWTVFMESSILDVWLNFERASVGYYKI